MKDWIMQGKKGTGKLSRGPITSKNFLSLKGDAKKIAF